MILWYRALAYLPCFRVHLIILMFRDLTGRRRSCAGVLHDPLANRPPGELKPVVTIHNHQHMYASITSTTLPWLKFKYICSIFHPWTLPSSDGERIVRRATSDDPRRATPKKITTPASRFVL